MESIISENLYLYFLEQSAVKSIKYCFAKLYAGVDDPFIGRIQ